MHYAAGSRALEDEDLFDPRHYPRTYGVAARYRVLFLLLGGAVLLGGLLGMWYFGSGHEMRSAREALVFVVLCFGFTLLGGALVLYVSSTRLTLYPDAIELRDFVKTRRLRRQDIAGRRVLEAQHVSVLMLEPERGRGKPLKITRVLATDAIAEAWFATLPDLDAKDLERSTAEIAAASALGRTPAERIAKLAAARRLARLVNGAAIAASAWGLFYPHPYGLAMAVLAAIPLAALALCAYAAQLYQIAGHRTDARAALTWAFMGPGIVLGLRALLDVQLLDWRPALAAAAACAVVLALVAAATDRTLRAKRWDFAAVVLFAGFYAYGAIVQANALLDRSVPETYRAAVIAKREAKGRTTEYFLRLSPWGPRTSEEEVKVPRALFRAIATGAEVCIAYRRGALGYPWFTVHFCAFG